MTLLGKPCPRIDGLYFIKGTSVPVPLSGKPMILEFWASWCGPCRMAFPHLSELARKYKSSGLVVIGINIEGDENMAKNMVNSQGSKMDYLVAVDSRQSASTLLMGAAGVSGIPAAFLVDHKGIIRHYGHPMDPKFSQMVDTVCKEASAASAASVPQPVMQTRAELMATPVKELKTMLTSWKIPFNDLNEKGELVDRILEKCH